MGRYVIKRGAIEANTVYGDNVLAASDCTISLPEVTFATADVQAMGTVSVPLLALIENMETSITKVGVDKNITILTTPGSHNMEVRWVQDVIKDNGVVEHEGCKAFMRVIPKTLVPGASLEIGNISENDLTFTVTRYKLVVNGEEVLLIDRFAQILRVNGKDYYGKFNKYL